MNYFQQFVKESFTMGNSVNKNIKSTLILVSGIDDKLFPFQ